jgi:ABC-type bacteriocin/lantibiotic exporter with double-glycine peptidase domain
MDAVSLFIGKHRFLFGLGILYYFEIGLVLILYSGKLYIIGYLLLSLAMAIYFVDFNLKQKRYTFQCLKSTMKNTSLKATSL